MRRTATLFLGVVGRVVLVRHGESTWNQEGRYIGWTDVPLTHKGEAEARRAGRQLAELGVEPDAIYCSMLKRAIETAWIMMEEMDMCYCPQACAWQLNERMYGLVGRTEEEAKRVFGADMVEQWAASYDQAPPPVDAGSPNDPALDPRYAYLDPPPPRTESLMDTRLRVGGYWDTVMKPTLTAKTGRTSTLLCVSHANTMRALMMHIDDIPRELVWDFDVPRATPIIYDFGPELRPQVPLGEEYVQVSEYMPLISGRMLRRQ